MAEGMRRKAVVTGGAAGIGRAVTLRLARDGYDVAVLDRDEVNGRRVGDHLQELEAGFFLPYDVTDYDQAPSVLDQAAEQLGGVDLLVCCAHVECIKPVEAICPDDWDRVVGTNLGGAVFTSRAASGHLADSSDGCIVLVSSIHARIASGAHAVYSAAMGGLAAAGRSLAAELEPVGVRCCTVSPYTALTESNRHRLDDPKWRELQESTVLGGRIMEPDDVAEVVSFVASGAGRVFNASDLAVDGGMSVFRERPATSAYASEEGK